MTKWQIVQSLNFDPRVHIFQSQYSTCKCDQCQGQPTFSISTNAKVYNMHSVANAKEFSKCTMWPMPRYTAISVSLTAQNITIKGLVLRFRVEILKAASNTEVYLTFRTVSHNFCVFALATWCFTIVTHNTSVTFG